MKRDLLGIKQTSKEDLETILAGEGYEKNCTFR